MTRTVAAAAEVPRYNYPEPRRRHDPVIANDPIGHVLFRVATTSANLHGGDVPADAMAWFERVHFVTIGHGFDLAIASRDLGGWADPILETCLQHGILVHGKAEPRLEQRDLGHLDHLSCFCWMPGPRLPELVDALRDLVRARAAQQSAGPKDTATYTWLEVWRAAHPMPIPDPKDLAAEAGWAEVEGKKPAPPKCEAPSTTDRLMALNETRAAEEKASPAKKREPEPPKTPPYGRLAGQFWISLAKHVSKSDAIDWLQRGRVDLSTPEKLARELERARTRISSRRDWLYEETLCDQHGCHEEVASVGVVPWMPQVTHLARIRCLCTAHRTSPGFDHVQDLEGASIDLAIAELAFRVKRGDFGGEPAPTPGPSDESPKAVRKRRT